MGVQIPIGASQLTFRFALEGDAEPMVITLGLDEVSLPDPTLYAVHATTESTGTGDIFAAASMISGYSFQGVTCTSMTASGPLVAEDNLVVAGTASGSALPSNCAILVRKNTALGGRRNRGRFYFPPMLLTEANVDPLGNINSVSFLQTALDGWYNALSSNPNLPPLVLLHSDGGSPTAITGFAVQSRIATQRRRMR